jgi:toxin ParE1/3/4
VNAYVLSAEATEDLKDIFTFGEEAWGEANASAYIHTLFGVFGHIGNHPRIGRSRHELGTGLKSFPHRSHVIFFMDWQGEIAIVRVLHSSRDHDAVFADYAPPSS